MIDLEREKDPNVLRQVAQLQEAELKRLRARLQQALGELARLKNQSPSALQQELIALQELIAQREHALFGRSSEKRSATPAAAAAAAPQRGHGPREQPELPVVPREHLLDTADQMCPSCGGVLSPWIGKTEDSEEIDVIERQYVVVKHVRQKYRCRCGSCVETALGPVKLRPGNRYSVNFAASVAVAKYLDHLPLERQVQMMRRSGLRVDSQTLWDQVEQLARVLADVPERLLAYVLQQGVIGMDETPWPLLKKTDKGALKTWYLWSITCRDAVVHRIFETRASDAAVTMLGDYSGVLVSDGYAGYDAAKKAGCRFTHAYCWAHVRRKFLDAERFYPREASAVVALVDELFAIERRCPTGPPGPEQQELRRQLRAERSEPIINALATWGTHLERTALPKSALGKAAAYMNGLWQGLLRFLENPHIPLSNNATERSLRGPVVGRKNHYGSKSKRGTEVAALFYTIFESAKLAGIDPAAYVRDAAHAALRGDPVPLPHEAASSQLPAG